MPPDHGSAAAVARLLATADRLLAPAELPEPRHGPGEARRAADEILSRPEYDWEEPSRNVLDRLVEWILDRLEGSLEPVGIDASLPEWVGWLVLLALVAAVAFFVYWRGRRHQRRQPVRRRRRSGAVVGDEAEVGIDWLAEAVRAETEGRWRDALRCRYRALVVGLSERGVIADLAGRTAAKCAEEVAANSPDVAATFRAATDLFEEAWYGGAAVGAGERDRMASLADDVLAAAPARARDEAVVTG